MSDSPVVKEWARLASLMSSKTVEHLTPGWVLDLVERLGSIALDPCAHPMAEASNRASQLNDSDGLKLDWHATVQHHSNPRTSLVFVNPPYGRELKAWAEKMASERHCAIVALVPCRTNTAWWNILDPVAWCALRGRISFYDETGQPQGYPAPFPSAICLLHASHLVSRFVEVFDESGPVYQRLRHKP